MEEIEQNEQPLFYFSDAQTPQSMSADERRYSARSPAAIWLYAVMALTLGLYVYSLVYHIVNGSAVTIAFAALTLIPIALSWLILILSIFGLWGIFLGWALRHKSLSGRDFRRHIRDDYRAALDAAQLREILGENALAIYADRVEISVNGQKKRFEEDLLESVHIDRSKNTFAPTFYLRNGQSYSFGEIPERRLSAFRRIFGCPVSIAKAEGADGDKKEWTGDDVGGIVMTGLAVAAGIALVAVHYTVAPSIPAFLGLLFFFGGLLGLLGVTCGDKPVCKKGAIPVLFGVMLISFSVGFFAFAMEKSGIGSPFLVIAVTPITILLVMLSCVGILIVLVGAVQIVRILTG